MMRCILTTLLVLAPLLAACAASGPTRVAPLRAERGVLFRESRTAQGALPYAVYVPRGYDPKQEWPCIVFLHGRGESGSDGFRPIIQGIGSAIQWNEAAWPAIVIFPQKPDEEQWESYDTFVMDCLAQTLREFSIDSQRITLTGLSQGGHGTWTMAANHPGVFAALAPICSYARPFAPHELAARVPDVPVWAFHGLADDVVPASATTDMMDALKAHRSQRGSSVELKLSLFEGVNHNAWDRAYRTESLAAWLLAQRRPAPASR
jgi:predicted peptidase